MAETVHVYVRETSGNPEQFVYAPERTIEGAERGGGGPGRGGRAGGASTGGRGGRGGAAGGRGAAQPVWGANRRPSGSAPKPASANGKRGEVPQYIKDRKAQLQHEREALETQERVRRAQEEIGYGKVKLTQEQKDLVISKLDEREEALKAELSRMPFRFDTLRMTNRKNEIADELEAIEKTRPRFKRDVVIVDKGSIAGVC